MRPATTLHAVLEKQGILELLAALELEAKAKDCPRLNTCQHAENCKHEGFKGGGYLFLGNWAVKAEEEEVLRQIMRFASKRPDREHSSFFQCLQLEL